MFTGFCRGLYDIRGINWTGGGLMFLGIIIIGIIVYLLLRDNNKNKNLSSSNAQDILKERLAKGEIDEAMYESLLNKINK